MTTHGGEFSASAASIDGSSHLLLEVAGLLHAGRMDGENATMCRVPRSHPEVAQSVHRFATFARDQYADAVLLLAALATKLEATGHAYARADEDSQRALDGVLQSGRLVDPQDR
ncbi:hypothetical protein E4198_09695 [Streptomyces sp. RKND-216]|uniref:hypothetical protein n=1 Tax=Streptomyces sp. RKND-216 TaxID=2562581 RepID=UPI00109DC00B|nr:hypothetical protein [Streptomyces sp. RKND-216]THA24963.1 hypothetical protein E4198_09695 [Streptomyces sp. RKND-216]